MMEIHRGSILYDRLEKTEARVVELERQIDSCDARTIPPLLVKRFYVRDGKLYMSPTSIEVEWDFNCEQEDLARAAGDFVERLGIKERKRKKKEPWEV